MEKMVSKRKKTKPPQKEKRGTSHGENKTHSFVVSMQGGGGGVGQGANVII